MKIEANEVRLGNWINGRIGHNIKVTSDVIMRLETGLYNYEAIPLTEQWLEYFGFEKIPLGYSKNISPFKEGVEHKTIGVDLNQGIYIRQGSIKESRSKDDLVSIWNNDLQGVPNVHQLQNLYFALTSHELEIKEG